MSNSGTREPFLKNKDRSQKIQFGTKRNLKHYTLKNYKFNEDDFMYSSTIWVGGTKSGKTVHSKYCLHKLKHRFPRVIVISGSNGTTGEWNGVVPDMFIYNEITMELVKKIWEISGDLTATYERANQYPVICSLFRRVANRGECGRLTKIQYYINEAKKKVRNSGNAPGVIKSDIEKIDEKMEPKLINYMKSVIRPKMHLLHGNLSEDELFAKKYINHNPNILMIIDDCATAVTKLIKTDKDKIIKRMFYEGRHRKLTHWYLVQCDKSIDSELRQNAFNIILTDPKVANTFAGHSNGLSKEEQNIIKSISKKLFNEKGWKKLIIQNKKPLDERYQSTEAERTGKFRTCTPAMWALNERIKNKGISHTTKYSKRFERYAYN
jgi:hypothetical protein